MSKIQELDINIFDGSVFGADSAPDTTVIIAYAVTDTSFGKQTDTSKVLGRIDVAGESPGEDIWVPVTLGKIEWPEEITAEQVTIREAVQALAKKVLASPNP